MYLYVFIDVKIKTDLHKSTGSWSGVTEWVYLMTQYHHTFTGLNLSPGYTYRSSVKFCARLFCFVPINSNGVTVLANNPITGALTINHQGSGTETVCWKILVEIFIDNDKNVVIFLK